MNRQNVSRHPEIVPDGPISPAPAGDNSTAEPVGVRESTMEAHTPTQPAQETEEESEPIVEPATIPAAVRKLGDHFISELPSVIHGRTRSSDGVDSRARSEEIDGGPSAFSGIYWKDERNSIALGAMLTASGAKSRPPIQEEADHLIAVQAASTLPPGITSLLPEEPLTIREAQESPEWSHWKGALEREMNGQINNGVWVQVERPQGKTVLGTKTLFKRKTGKDGQIEKYKCRFVTQGFRQVKGLHYHESSSPTPTASSMRAVLATAAVKNWELWHIDVEQAYL